MLLAFDSLNPQVIAGLAIPLLYFLGWLASAFKKGQEAGDKTREQRRQRDKPRPTESRGGGMGSPPRPTRPQAPGPPRPPRTQTTPPPRPTRPAPTARGGERPARPVPTARGERPARPQPSPARPAPQPRPSRPSAPQPVARAPRPQPVEPAPRATRSERHAAARREAALPPPPPEIGEADVGIDPSARPQIATRVGPDDRRQRTRLRPVRRRDLDKLLSHPRGFAASVLLAEIIARPVSERPDHLEARY